MYSNLLGCDGERVYYDGCCMVSINGEFVAQGSQFTLQEVEVTVATVDLDDITSYRGAMGTRRAQVEYNIKSHFYIFGLILCLLVSANSMLSALLHPHKAVSTDQPTGLPRHTHHQDTLLYARRRDQFGPILLAVGLPPS